MMLFAFCGMEGEFAGRQSEDQPPVVRIGEGEPERVTEERAIGLRVLRIDQGVDCIDQSFLLDH